MKQEQKLSEIVAMWEQGKTIQLYHPITHTWVDVDSLYNINVRRVYRVKPETIKIGCREVPRPLTSLNGFENVWLVDLYGSHPYEVFKNKFNRKVVEIALENGLLHPSKEAAIKHSEALIELNKEALK